MANIICYLCRDNLSFQKYDGKVLLSENGDKPCLECLLEAGAFDDVEENESEFG